jgi:hypothetical protein
MEMRESVGDRSQLNSNNFALLSPERNPFTSPPRLTSCYRVITEPLATALPGDSVALADGLAVSACLFAVATGAL